MPLQLLYPTAEKKMLFESMPASQAHFSHRECIDVEAICSSDVRLAKLNDPAQGIRIPSLPPRWIRLHLRLCQICAMCDLKLNSDLREMKM